jgi:hypothetical protein
MRTMQTGDYKLRHETSHSGYSHIEISRPLSGEPRKKFSLIPTIKSNPARAPKQAQLPILNYCCAMT